MKSMILTVDGMHCASCVGRVESALESTSGVVQARVNLALGQAAVEFLPKETTPAELADVVSKAGYAATVLEVVESIGQLMHDRRRREISFWRRRAVAGVVLLLPLLAITHLAGWSDEQTIWWQFVLASVATQY